MSTKYPAILQMQLSNDQTLIRDKDKEVRLVKNHTGETLAHFPRTDWEDLAHFFVDIADPDSLL